MSRRTTVLSFQMCLNSESSCSTRPLAQNAVKPPPPPDNHRIFRYFSRDQSPAHTPREHDTLSISLGPAAPMPAAPKPAALKPAVPSIPPKASGTRASSTVAVDHDPTIETSIPLSVKAAGKRRQLEPENRMSQSNVLPGTTQTGQEAPTPVTYGPSPYTHPCADEPTLRVVGKSTHMPNPLPGCRFKQQVNPSTRIPQFGDLKGKQLYEKIKDLPAWQQAQEPGCWFEPNAIAVSYLHSIEGMATEIKKVAAADLPIAHQLRMMGFSKDLASRCHRAIFYRFKDDLARALDLLQLPSASFTASKVPSYERHSRRKDY